MRKITVTVTGKLTGYAGDDEADIAAISRIVLDAEGRINWLGDIRAHLSVDEPKEAHSRWRIRKQEGTTK